LSGVIGSVRDLNKIYKKVPSGGRRDPDAPPVGGTAIPGGGGGLKPGGGGMLILSLAVLRKEL